MLVISRYDRGDNSEASARYLILFLVIYQRLQALEKPGRCCSLFMRKVDFIGSFISRGKKNVEDQVSMARTAETVFCKSLFFGEPFLCGCVCLLCLTRASRGIALNSILCIRSTHTSGRCLLLAIEKTYILL